MPLSKTVSLLERSATPPSSGMRLLRDSGDDQFALMDAFQSPQSGGNLPQLFGRTSEDDDFQAQVGCQMGVKSRDDQLRVIVLELHQLIPKLRAMVIVNERQGPGDIFRIFDPGPPGKRVMNQLPNSLAPRGKTFLPTKALKLL